MNRWIALAGLALAVSPPASPQSNTIPGADVSLGVLGSVQTVGREGTYPDGLNALAMSTTACNVGTVDVNWFAPMNADHPFIAFMIARDDGGRLVQISDRSYVKHGFYALSQSICTPCQNPTNGTRLGVGCADTYGVGHNGDNYWLGPPEEIDPWLGEWVPQCSHFDRGEPAASPPFDCDGVRSLSQSQANNLGPIGHRIQVSDADLAHPGSTYWFHSQYVVRGEAESRRENNMGSRRFTPNWNGSGWSLGASGTLQNGTILQRWSGATVASESNAPHDGRAYVAVVVTGPVNCMYHYEYAIHNRDNFGGIGGVRIPLAPGALVTNLGFRDIDQDPSNQWTASVAGDEIIFETNGNPIDWNMVYNFWFDTDAAPVASQSINLDQFVPIAFPPFLKIKNTAPTGEVCGAPAAYCTAKTNSQGCVPAVTFSGTPAASGTDPFDVGATGVLNNKSGLLFYGFGSASAPFQGGYLCVQAPIQRTALQGSAGNPPPGDCSGEYHYDFNARIRSGVDPSLVAGATVNAQYWSRDPQDPAGFGTGLTDALEFLIRP